MARELAPVDISTMPDVLRLVDAVQRKRLPQRLQRGAEDVAILVPARAHRRRRQDKKRSSQEAAAVLATSGAWQGLIDPDQLKRELNEAQSDSRGPISL